MNKALIPAMRKDLLTHAGAVRAAVEAVKRMASEMDPADEMTPIVVEFVSMAAEANMAAIYKTCESPIERLLFSSLAVGFLSVDPVGAIFRCRVARPETLNLGLPEPFAGAFPEPWALCLQAELPDVVVDGRSVRADMLGFVPGNPLTRVVVECDGYEYHNTAERFDGDRRRARALQQHGYTYVSYSGREIHNDPLGASQDLFGVLRRLREA